MERVALEVAMEDLETRIRLGDDAWDLAVGLSRATIQRQDAVVHLEDATSDHDDGVHVLFDVELPNHIRAAIHVELHVLLVGLHVQLLVGTREYHFEVVYSANLLGPDVNDEARTDLLPDGNVQGLLDGFDDDARFSKRSKLNE